MTKTIKCAFDGGVQLTNVNDGDVCSSRLFYAIRERKRRLFFQNSQGCKRERPTEAQ